VTTTTSPLDLLAALRLEGDHRWGDLAADFQWKDADSLFADDGPRWHFYTRPRGGSKTTDLAAVALVWLAVPAAPGARGYVFAGSKDQAALLLDAASGLVTRTPELSSIIEVQAQKMKHRTTGAMMEVRSADGDHAFGLRPSFIVVDELAQWEESRRAKRLWSAIVSSLAKVSNCRFVCLTSAGEPGHWSHNVLQEAMKAPDRWDVHEVPGPLPWVDVADLRAQGLRDSEFARLHLNIWTAAEDRLVNAEDLLAAAVLDGEQDARPGARYIVSCDLGLVNDKTVVAVGHAEATSDEAGAPRRVVVDSLRRWRGTRQRPVQLSEVEAYLALTAQRYNHAKVLADPWQAAGLIQRLKSQGIHCESFPFTATSTGRLGQSLHLALRNRLLWLPNDEALLSELARVRLRETGIGQARLDHDSGDHDDQAVAVAILVAELIGNNQGSTLRDWFETEHPTHSCGQPNPRAAVECMKCRERLTPKQAEPVAVQSSPPWTPWSPIPTIPENPQTAAALRLLEEARDPFRQQFSRLR
jgi:hypothetical protein